MKQNNQFLKKTIETPIGLMEAVADKDFLYSLEFVEKSKVSSESSHTDLFNLLEKEIKLFFSGELSVFSTPIKMIGTPFQIKVWEELRKIPFGTTISYLELAKRIGNEKAFRAVAQANGANKCCVIIPCHRVINSNGKIGGYSAGIERKDWLLNFEKKAHFCLKKGQKSC